MLTSGRERGGKGEFFGTVAVTRAGNLLNIKDLEMELVGGTGLEPVTPAM